MLCLFLTLSQKSIEWNNEVVGQKDGVGGLVVWQGNDIKEHVNPLWLANESSEKYELESFN